MNAWWNKYTGIPFENMGSATSGCDCWGLVRLVYKQEFGRDLPGPVMDVSGPRAKIEAAIHCQRDALWHRVDDPQPGDVALFRVRGHESHVGLVTVPGMILHIRENSDAVIVPVCAKHFGETLCGYYHYEGIGKFLDSAPAHGVRIMGKPHPFESTKINDILPVGKSLAEIINNFCDVLNVPQKLRNGGHAYVNARYVPFEQWDSTYPHDGAVAYFSVYPSGSGSGRMIGMIAVMALAAAATWYVGGTGAIAIGGLQITGLGLGSFAGAMAGLAVATIGMLALNQLFPTPTASLNGGDFSAGNQMQFLSGSQNSLRPYKPIPQVLGIGRMTLDYLGKPYTQSTTSTTNHLRAAYCAGYGPLEISDVREGDTLLSSYQDMQFEVFSGYATDPGPKYYTNDVDEQSLNIKMSKADGWHEYTTPDDTDEIIFEFYFPGGLWGTYPSGAANAYASCSIQIKQLPTGSYADVHKIIAARSFTLPQCSPKIATRYIYDDTGTLYTDDTWLSAYGVPKKSRAEYEEIDLYQWHVISVDKNNKIIMRTGVVTDNKNAEPSDRLLSLMAMGKYQWNNTKYTSRLPGLGENEEALYHVCVKSGSIIEVQDIRDGVSVVGCASTYMGLTLYIEAGTIDRGESDAFRLVYRSQKNAFTAWRSYNVTRGQYSVRVRQTSGDSSTQSTGDGTVVADIYWRTLRSVRAGSPFTPPVPVGRVELYCKATNQLNGTLDNINASVKSIVLDYDYESRAWLQRVSNNPASLFRHVLQGPAIPKKFSDSEIDIDTLVRWHNYCRVQGFTYFRIVGSNDGMSTFDLLAEIAAAGNAKPILQDGVWSVVIDEPRTTVVQHFTEHNSWGFVGTKTFIDAPHAIRANFVNEEKGYEQDIITVYADGYGPSNATKFEVWELDKCAGCTNPKHIIWKVRHAMYWAQLRPNTYKLYCDVEHIICGFGDLVRVTHSVPMWGLGSGRVVSRIMSAGKCIGVELDTPQNMLPADVYGIRFRLGKQRGKTRKLALKPVTTHDEYTSVMFTAGITSDVPDAGDMFQFGLLDRESRELVVSYIRPDENGNAEINMIDYAPEIFGNLDKPIPDFDSGITEPLPLPQTIVESIPQALDVYSDDRALIKGVTGEIISRIGVTFTPPLRAETSVAYIQLRYAEWQELTDGEVSGYGEWRTAEYVAVSNMCAFVSPVLDGHKYKIQGRFVTNAGLAGTWATLSGGHVVVGKTARPPDVSGFTAQILDAGGIMLSWNAVNVVDLLHYAISGAANLTTANTQIVAQVYKRTGNVEFTCSAVDTSKLTSINAATASVNIIAPASPVLTAKASVGGAVLRWKDCAKTWQIASYTIVDTDEGETYALNALELAMTPRGVGTYQFKATAEDKFQNKSVTSTNNITVTAPANPNPTISIDGADLVVSWPMVASFFPIDFYEVYSVDWTLGKKSKSNSIRFPATGIGVREFRVRAVDVAGNASEWVETSLTIAAPSIPSVKITLNDNKDGCILSWQNTGASLPIVAWDVVRQWDNDLGGGIIETLEEDFGRLDVNNLLVPSVPVGEHHYMVRGIDSAGNRSLWGEVVFTAMAPGKVTFSSSSVIDNNFLLYWTEPDSVFFAIAYYVFSEVDSDGYEMEIGRVDARFSSSFESAPGAYTYRVTPVDVAGNRGESADISMTISQPPDFMLFHDYDSLFNGTKTNFALDGRGSMYAPVLENETWQANTDRVAALLSTTADNLTWQQKVTGGYEYYNSPYSGTGTYVETVDVGTIIPSTKITVTVSRTVLEGNPNLTCKIETSLDNNAWVVAAANAFEVYATNFRYVRYTFTVAGGLLQIRNINYRLNIKRKTDFGTVSVAATDNGAGYPGDPMQIGKQVLFNTSFTDINGAPVCTIVNNDSASPLTPYTVFVDTLNPVGFRVFVLDKNGNRAAATVSWMVQGV